MPAAVTRISSAPTRENVILSPDTSLFAGMDFHVPTNGSTPDCAPDVTTVDNMTSPARDERYRMKPPMGEFGAHYSTALLKVTGRLRRVRTSRVGGRASFENPWKSCFLGAYDPVVPRAGP